MALKILENQPTFGQGLGAGLQSGLQFLMMQKMSELADAKRAQEAENQSKAYNDAFMKLLGQEGSFDPAGESQKFAPDTSQMQVPTILPPGMQQMPGTMATPGIMPGQPQAPQLGMSDFNVQNKPVEPAVPENIRMDDQNRLLRAIATPGISEKQRKSLIDFYKDNYSRKAEAFKETAAFRKNVTEGIQEAKEDLFSVDRMEELLRSGKLDTPGYLNFLKETGFDISNLKNPETQEFAKLSQNFVRNAKKYYGGRISNRELDQFLETIPSLMQSPEGMKRVIANMRRIAKGKMDYFNEYRKVMKEYKGVPPFDLQAIVQERVDKKDKKRLAEFRKDLKKPVPKGQAGWKTTAQTLGGRALGLGGQALGGGVKAFARGLGGSVGGFLGGGALGAAGGGLGSLFGS